MQNEEDTMEFTRLTNGVGDVTDMIRLKRFDKIRLGVKKRHTQSGQEYPVETDFLVCPPEVEAAYGDPTIERDKETGRMKLKVLDGVMFGSNVPEDVYREKLALYGKGTGLKCQGNGKEAKERQPNGTWKERTCPCEQLKTAENPKGACKPKGDLMVMLPKMPNGLWGNYQITTHSTYARAGILSSLKDLQLKCGRIGFIPLRLERIPMPIVHDGREKVHHIVGFTPMLTFPQIMELRRNPDLLMIESRAMEPPIDSNPEDDPVDCETDQLEPDEQGQIDAERIAHSNEEQMEAVRQQLRGEVPNTQPPPSPPPKIVDPADKPKATVATNTRDALKPVDKAIWDKIMNKIEDDPDLRDIKEQVKESMKIQSAKHERLNAPGQHEFLKRFQTLATTSGYGERLKSMFS